MAVEWEPFAGDRGWKGGRTGRLRSPRVMGAPCCFSACVVLPPLTAARTLMLPHRLQIDYYCRLDCLWKKKFKKEHEEFETMENVNRLLLENVLPAHVAAHFIGDKLNEVRCERGLGH